MAHYGGGETGGRRLETLRVLPHLRVLSDLQRIVLPGGLGIERDLYTQGRIVEDFIE